MKVHILIVTLWTLLMASCTNQTKEFRVDNTYPETPKVTEFKRRIGWNTSPARPDACVVVFDWDSSLALKSLLADGCTVIADDTVTLNGGAMRSVVLAKQDGRISVRRFGCGGSDAVVNQWFIDAACNNMMRTSPYEKADIGLPLLAVHAQTQQSAAWIVLMYDCCVSVRVDGDSSNWTETLRALCNEMWQSRSIVAASLLPTCESVHVPTQVKVGEEIQLTLEEPAAGRPGSNLLFVGGTTPNLADHSYSHNTFSAVAMSTGAAVIDATVVDRRTLLLNRCHYRVIIRDGNGIR